MSPLDSIHLAVIGLGFGLPLAVEFGNKRAVIGFDINANRIRGISLVRQPEHAAYDGIILAVAHEQFRAMGATAIRALGNRRTSSTT